MNIRYAMNIIVIVLLSSLLLATGCTKLAPQQPTVGSPQGVILRVSGTIGSDTVPSVAPHLQHLGRMYEVIANDGRLAPAQIEIQVGDTLEWVNKDRIRKTIVFDDLNTGTTLPKQGVASYTFMEAGEFFYHSINDIESDQNKVKNDRNDRDEVARGLVIVS